MLPQFFSYSSPFAMHSKSFKRHPKNKTLKQRFICGTFKHTDALIPPWEVLIQRGLEWSRLAQFEKHLRRFLGMAEVTNSSKVDKLEVPTFSRFTCDRRLE